MNEFYKKPLYLCIVIFILNGVMVRLYGMQDWEKESTENFKRELNTLIIERQNQSRAFDFHMHQKDQKELDTALLEVIDRRHDIGVLGTNDEYGKFSASQQLSAVKTLLDLKASIFPPVKRFYWPTRIPLEHAMWHDNEKLVWLLVRSGALITSNTLDSEMRRHGKSELWLQLLQVKNEQDKNIQKNLLACVPVLSAVEIIFRYIEDMPQTYISPFPSRS